jgi:aminobenzoyl-glutamate utilization protein B
MKPVCLALLAMLIATTAAAQTATRMNAARKASIKAELLREIDGMQKMAQVMNDSVFSFSELGFQEFETSKYLTGVLEKEGFRIERGVAGIPTAFVATWGSGKPVIALGSDIDDIPQASQKPGVAYKAPLVEGAPGHGEGHNSGVPLNIVAALAVKKVMEREKLPGTLMLWPGVGEELLGAKAFYVRAGVFKDVDVVLFAHVANDFSVAGGPARNITGLVSVEYRFEGETAHSAAAPWRGKSALDAVELMNVGWNYRREHIRIGSRVHYVVTNGGDQPNVVPRNASVWYYYREADYPHIMDLWRIGDDMAKAAALMTGTTVTSRLLGAAYPPHLNVPVAEAMSQNISAVGMPQWSADDQSFAKAFQKEMGVTIEGLPLKVRPFRPPAPVEEDEQTRNTGPSGGGSDDIGDVSWVVPTVILRYPANMPGGPGHNWANAIAMATPIAHKGVVAGAKAQALTVFDLLTKPELVASAWKYFREVQTKDTKYQSFLRPDDEPATWLNKKTMDEYRPKLEPFYYDSEKYGTYLEQLGVKYPVVR